jgi:hypothetical protein
LVAFSEGADEFWRGSRRLAVDEHAEGNRRSHSGRQHQTRVARVKAESDARAPHASMLYSKENSAVWTPTTTNPSSR